MDLRSTSTQRTYRYLRLSLVGAVLLLFTSLAQVLIVDGSVASVSALFYTPGRGVFVGTVFAIALALVALSGHSVEQALLDLAAVCAPLIAIVPTPVAVGDVAGAVVDCPEPGVPCVPAAELAGIQNGMTAVLVLGGVGIVGAVVLATIQRTLSRGVVVTVLAAAAIVVGAGLWWMLGPASFTTYAHVVATASFFGLIAAVAVVSAATSVGAFRATYLAIAVGITVVLVLLVTVMVLRLNGVDLIADVPLILIGEVVALVLFAVFWVLQTIENWEESDPALIARAGEPRR